MCLYIGNHRLPEIQSGNLFEACLISETVQVTTGNFGPFRNGRIGVSVKWRCECEMTRFRQLPNLGSSFSHCSRCEFTGNGRDPYLVGLEGCQFWAPLRGGNLGLGRISSKSILNLGGNLGSPRRRGCHLGMSTVSAPVCSRCQLRILANFQCGGVSGPGQCLRSTSARR